MRGDVLAGVKAILALLLLGSGLAALSFGCQSTDEAQPRLDPKQPADLLPAITASIQLAEKPRNGVAVAVGESGVWVGSYSSSGDSASVTHVDPERNKVVARIPFDLVDDVAVGAGAVWVLGAVSSEDETRGAVFRIDPETHEVVATIPIACERNNALPECSGMSLAATEDGIWVGLERMLKPSQTAGEVVRIDPASNDVVARIPTQGRPQELVPGEGALWVASLTVVEGAYEGGPLLRIDPDTNTVAAALLQGELSGGTRVPALALGEDALWTSAYVFEPKETSLAIRIDARTYDVTRKPLSIHHFSPFAVAEGGVWFYGSGGLSRLNPQTLEVDESVDFDAAPIDAAFDPATRSFWLLDEWPSVVRRIDLR